MSIRALLGLVALILGGVAWSVRWYLDGAEALAAAPRVESVAALPCGSAPCEVPAAAFAGAEASPDRAPEALTWREAQHAGWSHCDLRKGERPFGGAGEGFDASKVYWGSGAGSARFPDDAIDDRPAKREPPS